MSIRLWCVLILLSVTTSLWMNSVHIHAKAVLAQTLIARSWSKTSEGSFHKPWLWADTWPVARLLIAGTEQYVLSGAHGSALAFGPGLVDGSAKPGTRGISVIAGHRDTHFAGLAHLETGALITVQGENREWSAWYVTSISIEDSSQTSSMSFESDGDLLVLVTCYPFDAIDPGGPLRFVVKARRKEWGQAPAILAGAW